MASTTPRLDAIINEFTRRIGDPATYSGDSLQNGNILTSGEILNYVNRALNRFFFETFKSTGYNISQMMKVIPELVTIRSYEYGIGTTYVIYDPDIFSFHSASTSSGKFVQVYPRDFFNVLKTGINPYHIPTSAKPALVESGGLLYLFPENLTALEAVTINAQGLKMPLKSDGTYLTQDGASLFDSPYNYIWTGPIADLAEEMYRRESQEAS